MRALTLLISAFLVVLVHTQVAAAPQPFSNSNTAVCKVVLPHYITVIAEGETPQEALANARELCGSKLIDKAFEREAEPDDEMMDSLITACVNLTCQS